MPLTNLEHAQTEKMDVPESSSDTISVASGSHNNNLLSENGFNVSTTAAGVNEVGRLGSSMGKQFGE